MLYQALEAEKGGQAIYQTAIRCAKNPELKEEWRKYLEETRHHEQVLLKTFERLSLDSRTKTPGRSVVRDIGKSLVKAMEKALEGDRSGAELVAAECVVLAETKDHLNWKLISAAGEEATGDLGRALREATEEVEDQEDEHLYHSAGWAREIWLQSMGIQAVLPPPEEQKEAKTAIGASRAEHAREEMLPKQ